MYVLYTYSLYVGLERRLEGHLLPWYIWVVVGLQVIFKYPVIKF